MGDIFRKIDICGLDFEGEPLTCLRDVDVLIDSGTTRTVISRRLARRLRGRDVPKVKVTVEGRRVPVKVTLIELHADGCENDVVSVAVSDDLAGRAGTTRDGETVDVILGTDYLQRHHVGTRHGEGEDQVVCEAAPLRSLGDSSKRRR